MIQRDPQSAVMVFLLPYTGTSSKQHGRVNNTNLDTVASAAFKQGKLVLFLEQVAVQWMHLSVQYRARNNVKKSQGGRQGYKRGTNGGKGRQGGVSITLLVGFPPTFRFALHTSRD